MLKTLPLFSLYFILDDICGGVTQILLKSFTTNRKKKKSNQPVLLAYFCFKDSWKEKGKNTKSTVFLLGAHAKSETKSSSLSNWF